jgi:glycerol-3-phosphate dehydrogenase (NAD(P)+)
MAPSDSPLPAAAGPPLLVLGGGGWGTALALVLRRAGHEARVWCHDPQHGERVEASRENSRYLPGVRLPPGIRFGSRLEELAAGVEVVFSVVPTQFLRAALESFRGGLPLAPLVVSCSKGFERGTLELPSSIISALLPASRVVILSGPSHAEEVARELPTAVVVASRRPAEAQRVQQLITGPRFRAYTSSDPAGVEIAGAAKNVIALAAGIADGIGFGDNARASLVCRGMAEITRLGAALGARAATFAGLAGIGDLVATCTSRHSRNRAVGVRIAQGEPLDAILRSTHKVAEGVETARSLRELAGRLGIELPITAEVYSVLFEGKPPREAVEALMGRELKEEA